MEDVISEVCKNAELCIPKGLSQPESNVEQSSAQLETDELAISPARKKAKLEQPNYNDLSDEEQEPIDEEEQVSDALREVEFYSTCTREMFATSGMTELEWWNLAKHKLPHLAKLARWSWSVQSGSAASERQFSKAGFINNRYRQA